MSDWNIAAKPKDEQRQKERLNMPVIAEQVAREQPEHLREYFMERVRFYREQSIQLPRASDPRYIEMAEQNAKK
ncbi:DNA polymerase III subunit theta [Citrobacter koseri]|uniref:DNA polymerase III subunit theta n=1 Tax=Citrobacter koseri TaxID=545 RepID=UPI0023B050CB|nr:DNA polymerase III subunit theta [Citrobacter koseri]